MLPIFLIVDRRGELEPMARLVEMTQNLAEPLRNFLDYQAWNDKLKILLPEESKK